MSAMIDAARAARTTRYVSRKKGISESEVRAVMQSLDSDDYLAVLAVVELAQYYEKNAAELARAIRVLGRGE